MKKSIRIFHPSKTINGSYLLPGSKSESNRALIINKLSGNKVSIENLSSAEDTLNLVRMLSFNTKKMDVKDSGSSMRFLTAYFCAINKNRMITGSQRMQERPIGKLVDALREIGFKIYYTNKEGFPPVEIIPAERQHLKYEVSIDGDESSQFVSALLLIAPVFPDGLTIKLKNKIVSRPYIEMTLEVMKMCGINYEWKKNEIRIDHQHYQETVYKVEPDWSAASYWYSIVAISEQAEIDLTGLKANSLQGDKIIAEWMKHFGVITEFLQEGVRIKKVSEPTVHEMNFDFTDHPDLAQTMLVLAATKNINLKITGLQSLRIKETDRIAAMQNELKKIGAELIEHTDDHYELKTNFNIPSENIHTYNDHRMAMSFAPLAVINKINIIKPIVVMKSYPEFWEHLNKAGFILN